MKHNEGIPPQGGAFGEAADGTSLHRDAAEGGRFAPQGGAFGEAADGTSPHRDAAEGGCFPPPPFGDEKAPPFGDEGVTPPMLVNELSRLFAAWMRNSVGDTAGVMSQNSARSLLGVLARRDGVTQLELVRATHLKPPTVSVTLKKMEAEGLLRRETDGQDQRAVRVYLTEKGRGHDEFVRHNLHRADRIMMQNFSAEEYALAKKVLLRMRNNILKDLNAQHAIPEADADEQERKNYTS